MANDSNEDPDEFVFLVHAKSAMAAQNLAGLLRGSGIRIHVPGANLTDQWVFMMQSIGAVGADLHVPRCQLEEAQLILENAKAAGRSPESEDEPT